MGGEIYEFDDIPDFLDLAYLGDCPGREILREFIS